MTEDGGQVKSGSAALFGRRRNFKSPSEALQPQAAPPPPKTPDDDLRPKKRRRSRFVSIGGFLSFIMFAAICVMGALGLLLLQARKAGPLAADKVVVITRDDLGGTIADQLERNGVIASATWFNLVTLFDGARSAMKRGEYSFKAGASMRDIEEELTQGTKATIKYHLTIPEGWTSEQVVTCLRDPNLPCLRERELCVKENAGQCPTDKAERFANLVAGEIREIPPEGSLFPDTYPFERGDSRQALLKAMQESRKRILDEIWKKRAADLTIRSPGELVTLASIVEKETRKTDERPRVAGVYINRLQKNMKLQSDPTIVYGLVRGKGTLGHAITKSELLQVTEYNTYAVEGLPPGPICNPGRAALEAVANPSKTRELFFVADGTGGHAFAETLDQHNKNVVRWRQIEKDAKDKLAPDAAPGGPHGALQFVDPRVFGWLTPLQPTAPTVPALAQKLAKVGAELAARETLLGAQGPFASGKAKTPEDLGVVVIGVNDEPPQGDFFAGGKSEQPKSEQALAFAPTPTRGIGLIEPVNPGAPMRRPRAFDASEGTALDPLRNKTYDLSYAKTLPRLQ